MSHTNSYQYLNVYLHYYRCTHCRKRVRVVSLHVTCAAPKRWYKLGSDRHACSKRCLAILDPARAILEAKATPRLLREAPTRVKELQRVEVAQRKASRDNTQRALATIRTLGPPRKKPTSIKKRKTLKKPTTSAPKPLMEALVPEQEAG